MTARNRRNDDPSRDPAPGRLPGGSRPDGGGAGSLDIEALLRRADKAAAFDPLCQKLIREAERIQAGEGAA